MLEATIEIPFYFLFFTIWARSWMFFMGCISEYGAECCLSYCLSFRWFAQGGISDIELV